jgi:hypothetical protein
MLRHVRATFGVLLLLLIGAEAAAHPPYGLVADERGNLYFSDLEAVWRMRPDGRLVLFRPAVADVHVHELRLAPGGDIVGDENRYDPASQTFYTAIWRRSPDGRETYLLPSTAAPPNGSGLWVDARGNSYSAQWLSSEDRRTILLRRSPQGRSDVLFGDRKAGAAFRQVIVSSVGGMAFAADGSLLFADGPALRRLSPAGQVTRLFQGEGGTVLRGIVAAPGGRVLAADSGNGRLLSIGSDGRAEPLYRSPRGWLPMAVALARGRLWALEAEDDPNHRSHRVRVIEVKDGRGRVAAMPGETATNLQSTPPEREGWAGIAGGAMLAAVGGAYLLRRARARRLQRP